MKAHSSEELKFLEYSNFLKGKWSLFFFYILKYAEHNLWLELRSTTNSAVSYCKGDQVVQHILHQNLLSCNICVNCSSAHIPTAHGWWCQKQISILFKVTPHFRKRSTIVYSQHTLEWAVASAFKIFFCCTEFITEPHFKEIPFSTITQPLGSHP